MNSEDIDKIIEQALAEEKGEKAGGERRKKRKREEKKKMWKLILNTIFMIGAIATVVVYFACPENRSLFICLGFGSMFVKVIEFAIRFLM